MGTVPRDRVPEFFAPTHNGSLWQNILFFIGLFCKRDLSFAFVMGTVPRDCVHSTGVRNGVATISMGSYD